MENLKTILLTFTATSLCFTAVICHQFWTGKIQASPAQAEAQTAMVDDFPYAAQPKRR